MAIRLNQEAVEHAQNLIVGRQYERESDWSEVQPSADGLASVPWTVSD